jgi:hypothetical protein
VGFSAAAIAADFRFDNRALECIHPLCKTATSDLEPRVGLRSETRPHAEHEPVGNISQLAHIARPLMGKQPGLDLRGDLGDFAAIPRTGFARQVKEQQRYVVLAGGSAGMSRVITFKR